MSPEPEVTPTPEPTPTPTPTPAPTPTPSGTWLDRMPDSLKVAKTLSKFKGTTADEVLPEIANAYVNLEQSAGGRIKIPGEQSGPEEKAAFRKALGVPDTPDGYEKPVLPEGMSMDEALVGRFFAKAHEIGTPKAHVNEILKWFLEESAVGIAEQGRMAKQAEEEGWAALRKEWGAATDVNVGYSQQVVADFGGQEMKELLASTGIGNNPLMVKFLSKIGRVLAEDGVMTPVASGVSVEGAKAEIQKILSDPKHPYHNRGVGHDEAVARVRELHEIVYNAA